MARKSKWSRTLLALSAAALLIPLGCKKPAETSSTAAGGAAPRRQIRIGMVAKSESNDVFQAAKAGAFDAAKELSAKDGVDITIEWRTPPSEDAAMQADNINSLVVDHVDGITVSCSDARTLTNAINDAVDKGIPVVCFDSDAPNSKRMCVYGTDDHKCGVDVMKHLAQVMDDKGTIAILAGNESAPNLQIRVQGVLDELKNHPNIHLLSNGIIHHVETPADAIDAVKRTMTANPGQINGWAMIGGWPLFTVNALDWQPGTIKVVSVDALPKELTYLEDGYVQVLLAQDCYGWGHKTVEILVNKILYNKTPDKTRIIDPLQVVTKENVQAFSKNWSKWLGH